MPAKVFANDTIELEGEEKKLSRSLKKKRSYINSSDKKPESSSGYIQ
jgi:hypothetical protein